MFMSKKKLYRSDNNKVVAGIFGGLGEYYDIDPVLLRLFWLLVVVSTGVVPGIIVYMIAILVVPKKLVIDVQYTKKS
jgi:phage shock protein PspC (stress-responsive transcriptional regulator)